MKSFRILVPLLPLILPAAVRWVQAQEAVILREGESLSPEQIRDADQAGVSHPEKIRLLCVDAIPMPGHPALLALGKWTGLVSSGTAGITLGYGIYLRRSDQNDRELLVHECVHVGQYERLGSISSFLRPYLRECLGPGYPWGPMEQEAIHRAHGIVNEV